MRSPAAEQRLHAPLADVRVHADEEAPRAAAAQNASAFTIGDDIWFGAGRYAPHDESGRRLIGRELVHVVQQRGGGMKRRPKHARWRRPLPKYGYTEAQARAMAANETVVVNEVETANKALADQYRH